MAGQAQPSEEAVSYSRNEGVYEPPVLESSGGSLRGDGSGRTWERFDDDEDWSGFRVSGGVDVAAEELKLEEFEGVLAKVQGRQERSGIAGEGGGSCSQVSWVVYSLPFTCPRCQPVF